MAYQAILSITAYQLTHTRLLVADRSLKAWKQPARKSNAKYLRQTIANY
jgi:hypothetical protein